MKRTGRNVVIIEDDLDDQDLIAETFNALPYELTLVFFTNGAEAIKYIEGAEVLPLFIISDINMPVINGIEVRKQIQKSENVKLKCVPFIFFTTSNSKTYIEAALLTCAQGYFIKPSKMIEYESTIKKIIEYWENSICSKYLLQA